LVWCHFMPAFLEELRLSAKKLSNRAASPLGDSPSMVRQAHHQNDRQILIRGHSTSPSQSFQIPGVESGMTTAPTAFS
jgi:hypothetical protein